MRALKSLTIFIYILAGVMLLSNAAHAEDEIVSDNTNSDPPALCPIDASQGRAFAEVMTPLSIISVNGGTLAFGQIVPLSGGTVTVSPEGMRTSSGGVQVIQASSVSAAQFQVGGAAGRSFSIFLPSSITISNGKDSMTVDDFTSNPSSSSVLDSIGKRDLSIGATLHVKQNQSDGNYSGSFTVTVAYN
jgi:hypothetical protein